MKDLIKKTSRQIAEDFDIEQEGISEMSEEELLQLLSEQVAFYLEHRLEFLLSSMYRLDIDENKVSEALLPTNPEPANIALAKLILERQKKRVFTKHFYKQEKIEDLEEGLEY